MQSWRLGDSPSSRRSVSPPFLLTQTSHMCMELIPWNRANPNQKAADLISFDAFADDEDEKPLSGHGGLSLPVDNPPSSSSSSGAGMTSSGLPLDLFTAPSPAPSPGLSSHSSARVPSGQMRNPMDFFNTATPSQSPQQPNFGGGMQGSHGGFGGMSGSGSGMRGASGGGTNGQNAGNEWSSGMGPTMPSGQTPNYGRSQELQQPNVQGYSLSPSTPQTNGRTASKPSTPVTQSQQSQQPAPAQKRDAFADLVNLMD